MKVCTDTCSHPRLGRISEYMRNHIEQPRSMSLFLAPRRRLSKSRWIGISVLVSIMLMLSALVSSYTRQEALISSRPLPLRTAAPDFRLPAVRGGSYRLQDMRGQVVLLSFINTRWDQQDDRSDPSRSQIVFLKSMHAQYSTKGVQILAVDASGLSLPSTQDELINFTYDHNLPFPLLVNGTAIPTARQFGVQTSPTTFLIDAKGTLVQRWEGFAPAPALAFALKDVLGESLLSTPAP